MSVTDQAEREIETSAIVRALLVKYGGAHGTAMVGSETLRWAGRKVDIHVERDGDALRIEWKSPPVNGSGGEGKR
jgi:hypothetical protein